MLDQQGYLTLRPACGAAQRIFIDEQNLPIRLNPKSCGGSGRIKIAVADWDGDGRLDVLANSENAAWYRNCEERDGRVVLKSASAIWLGGIFRDTHPVQLPQTSTVMASSTWSSAVKMAVSII